MSGEDERGAPTLPFEPELRKKMKAALRASLRAQRLALPIVARQARARALAERLAALPELVAARVVLSYNRIHGEMDATPTLERLSAKAVFPRVDDDSLTLHEVQSREDLETSMYGVLEPRAEAPLVPHAAVDVVLVPALAVDARGFRIGYGRGFYDRLLPTLPNAVTVAIVYDFQLVAEVPEEPFDVPVHVVATDARVLRVR